MSGHEDPETRHILNQVQKTGDLNAKFCAYYIVRGYLPPLCKDLLNLDEAPEAVVENLDEVVVEEEVANATVEVEGRHEGHNHANDDDANSVIDKFIDAVANDNDDKVPEKAQAPVVNKRPQRPPFPAQQYGYFYPNQYQSPNLYNPYLYNPGQIQTQQYNDNYYGGGASFQGAGLYSSSARPSYFGTASGGLYSAYPGYQSFYRPQSGGGFFYPRNNEVLSEVAVVDDEAEQKDDDDDGEGNKKDTIKDFVAPAVVGALAGAFAHTVFNRPQNRPSPQFGYNPGFQQQQSFPVYQPQQQIYTQPDFGYYQPTYQSSSFFNQPSSSGSGSTFFSQPTTGGSSFFNQPFSGSGFSNTYYSNGQFGREGDMEEVVTVTDAEVPVTMAPEVKPTKPASSTSNIQYVVPILPPTYQPFVTLPQPLGPSPVFWIHPSQPGPNFYPYSDANLHSGLPATNFRTTVTPVKDQVVATITDNERVKVQEPVVVVEEDLDDVGDETDTEDVDAELQVVDAVAEVVVDDHDGDKVHRQKRQVMLVEEAPVLMAYPREDIKGSQLAAGAFGFLAGGLIANHLSRPRPQAFYPQYHQPAFSPGPYYSNYYGGGSPFGGGFSGGFFGREQDVVQFLYK